METPSIPISEETPYSVLTMRVRRGEDAGTKSGDHSGVAQHGSGKELLACRPVLGVEGIVRAVKLNNVLVSVWKRCRVGLTSPERGQSFLRVSCPRPKALPNGGAVLAPLRFDPS